VARRNASTAEERRRPRTVTGHICRSTDGVDCGAQGPGSNRKAASVETRTSALLPSLFIAFMCRCGPDPSRKSAEVTTCRAGPYGANRPRRWQHRRRPLPATKGQLALVMSYTSDAPAPAHPPSPGSRVTIAAAECSFIASFLYVEPAPPRSSQHARRSAWHTRWGES
jgi:hypothetical protein